MKKLNSTAFVFAVLAGVFAILKNTTLTGVFAALAGATILLNLVKWAVNKYVDKQKG